MQRGMMRAFPAYQGAAKAIFSRERMAPLDPQERTQVRPSTPHIGSFILKNCTRCRIAQPLAALLPLTMWHTPLRVIRCGVYVASPRVSASRFIQHSRAYYREGASDLRTGGRLPAGAALLRSPRCLVFCWVGAADGFVEDDVVGNDLVFCVQQGFFQAFAGENALPSS